MAADENSRHNKTAFLMLQFEFGSVAVFSILVTIFATPVTYIMTLFIVDLLEQAKKCGLKQVQLELTREEKLLSLKLLTGDFIHADVR